jgi:glyceraldehyde 3-phosphate dehydrogenase
MSPLDIDATLAAWIDNESVAEAMVPIIGGLYRRHNVVTTIYGRRLPNRSASELLKLHRFARHLEGRQLSPQELLPVLHRLTTLDLGPVVIDVADLNRKFRAQTTLSLDEFLRDELDDVVDQGAYSVPPRDVVLYGFGRIGRLVARILLARAGGASGLRLRAVVVRGGGTSDLVKRASLLRRDSVHGPFDGTITVDAEHDRITANGTVIQFIRAESPDDVDYAAYGITDAIIVDNTGKWRDRAGLSQHLSNDGAARVLLTAPGKGDVPNVVFGVNHDRIGTELVIAAASCTTNAVTPVLAAIDREYGIVHGHVETVHSFTNDQNLTDNFHPSDRRGRAAGLNMVITETGAARAVAKAYPALEGKLTGSAIRVPTPDGSVAVLNLQLDRPATKEQLNTYLRTVSLRSALHAQVDFVDSPELVSSDIIGSRKAGVVDGLATIADGGRSVVVYVWYDNEHGYSRQVARILESMTGVQLRTYPTPEWDADHEYVPNTAGAVT